MCIFCEDASGRLHQFSTLQSDASIRSMAKDLRDASLLAKIDGGDLIALEAKYHLSCLATLRNCHRSHVRGVQSASEDSFEKEEMEARALVELLTHIESSVEEGNFFFKLSELRFLYESCLKDLKNSPRFVLRNKFFHTLLKPKLRVMEKTSFLFLRKECR